MKNRSAVVVFFVLLINFICPQQLFAVAPRGLFSHYKNPIFVETGSYRGDGIRMALKDGFRKIYSIELARHHYEYCKNEYKNLPEVKIFWGDSAKVLPEILKEIDQPATFWLDAHYSYGDTAKGSSMTPILAELDAIAKHHIRTHTILIDDFRCFGTEDFDYIEQEKVIEKLLEINPNYKISRVDGYVKRDILVAVAP